MASLENEYLGQGYGRLKTDVAGAVIALVEPIQARFAELRSDDQELDAMLAAGAIRTRETAQNTLREVHDLLGFIPRSRLVG